MDRWKAEIFCSYTYTLVVLSTCLNELKRGNLLYRRKYEARRLNASFKRNPSVIGCFHLD